MFLLVLVGCLVAENAMAAISCKSDVAAFFAEINCNLTQVTWAHAVNNNSLLYDALNDSSIMMLEADILLGVLIDGDPNQEIPIMGHPPDTKSDLSLESFLSQVFEYNENATVAKKGVKLDFKSTEVFSKSQDILTKVYSQIDYPLWINADIIKGPVNAATTPVDPATFFEISKLYPNATLSVGWTTNYPANATASYTTEQINNMLDAIKDNNVTQPITFPVRAGIAAQSADLMENLVKNVTDSTLTIWSSEGDSVDVKKLVELIETVGFEKVYVDVPESLKKELTFSGGDRQFAFGALVSVALVASLIF